MKISYYILNLPRSIKKVIVVLIDLFLCFVSGYFAFYLKTDQFIIFNNNNDFILMFWTFIISFIIYFPIFIIFNTYHAIFRYSGVFSLFILSKAFAYYSIIYIIIFTFIGFHDVPRTIGIIQPLLFYLSTILSRVLIRLFLGDYYYKVHNKFFKKKALIYGAGSSGRQLAAMLIRNREIQPVGFLDDDAKISGQFINGLPIYYTNNIKQLIANLGVDQVLLAMPNLKPEQRSQIFENLKGLKISIRTISLKLNFSSEKINTFSIRELEIDDLIGRDIVNPDFILMEKSIFNKVVLITGSGGSIGSEICRQIVMLKPKKILLIDHSEFALYNIDQELEKICLLFKLNFEKITLLGSIKDEIFIRQIISKYRPQIIFHAAAYKHVPLVELNVIEGIRNNVFGTLYLSKAAGEYGVENFILISTDKAVRPSNIMGASKRLAEMILQGLNEVYPSTKFSMVRFGNVLESSGSVVPKFRQQIIDGDSITLTHPEVTRYFMTVTEAAQLVIQSASMANGGDLFVLDMGNPVKIIDIAKKLIEFYGLKIKDIDNPDGDISIDIVGLRPGEKLHEELLIGNNPISTSHSRIIKANEEFLSFDVLNLELMKLEDYLNKCNYIKIFNLLKKLIVDVKFNYEFIDLMNQEKNYNI